MAICTLHDPVSMMHSRMLPSPFLLQQLHCIALHPPILPTTSLYCSTPVPPTSPCWGQWVQALLHFTVFGEFWPLSGTQVLQSLQGSVLPCLFGVGRLAFGTPFVATSVVQGTRLSDIQTFTPAVCDAALKSLSRIHALGVGHGDISLSNLMLVAGDRVAVGSDDDLTGSSGSPDETAFLQPLDNAAGSPLRSDGTSSSDCPHSHQHTTVVILDLGRAYMCLEPKELDEEMNDLKQLLG